MRGESGCIDFNTRPMRRVPEAVLALSWPLQLTSSEMADQATQSGPVASGRLQSPTNRIRSREAAWEKDGGEGRENARLPSDSGRPEGHRRIGGFAMESHPP